MLPTNTAGLPIIPVTPPSSIVMLQKRVMLVLPWGKHTNPISAYAVAQLQDRRRVTTALNWGDAFVAHSRNSCADLFLASDKEWMLTIDDDMIVPFGNAEWYNAHTRFNFSEKFAGLNALDRLLSHGKTLVGALYFGRYPGSFPMYGEGANEQEGNYARSGPHDVCKPTRWVGTGCMLIHRSVYEDIEKRFPRLARDGNGKGGNWFSSSEHSIMDWVDKTRKMLSTGPMDGTKAMKAYEMLEAAHLEARSKSSLGMGEDVQFCIRAQEAGHQPHVDMGLIAGHIGHCVFGPKNTGIKPVK